MQQSSHFILLGLQGHGQGTCALLRIIGTVRFLNQSLSTLPHPPPLVPLTHIIQEGRVTAWLGQQQPDSVQAPILTGTHQCCGPICILCVDICPTF